MSSSTRNEIEAVFRSESGRVLSHLMRVLGDMDLAEDALQDACAEALTAWPRDGLPRQPAAWLTTAARRRALDRLRSRRRRPEQEAMIEEATPDPRDPLRELEQQLDWPIADDRLQMIFLCCHPALAREAQVALTLRTLGGLDTRAIARAFLQPESAVSQRLLRAKQKIAEAKIPFRRPRESELPERLPSVLAVLYLVFNEGYSASGGDRVLREELCDEALRLAKLVAGWMPDEEEAQGLLALLLLSDARRAARLDADGELVLLEHQDRARWNARQIEEGRSLLLHTLSRQRLGPYQLEAAIAAVHADAQRFEDTDWAEIAALYDRLLALRPSPVGELNRAAALLHVHGPAHALATIDALLAREPRMADYVYAHVARAEMLRRLSRRDEARGALERALALARTEVDARQLQRKLAELAD
ncbi:MAG: sigma-70 family RNA polymerase sigma factor [Planctomycetes bacterium]|nr:sigma-70 family RNA polymerase sigma factor [Planctomycetota bacterium]